MTAPSPVGPGVAVLRADNPGPMTLDGTNSYLVDSAGGRLVVDPGPADPAHLGALAASGPVTGIVLTHRHVDHSAGAAALAQLTGAPVWARDPAYGQPLLANGGVVDGALEVIDSPGHSDDSVCLLHPASGALLTGDTVLGRGTSVIAHPDGRLADYLRTLAALRRLVDERPVQRLLPGHGSPLDDPAAVLDGYLDHRAKRLAAVRAAVAAGDRNVDEVVRRVYADVDPVLWPAAARSVRAQLDYLAYDPPAEPG